jgi:predicted glycosyltransferase
MKIILYCQYIWGIGHLFRSLEICRALSDHELILVTGGLPVDASLPKHVREFRLPGLMMDDDYRTLIPTDEGKSVDAVKKERLTMLTDLFRTEAPDIFLVELYPFGRRAFRYELDPVFQGIRNGDLPRCRVVCSLRDILVEKKDPTSYENRVIDALNRYFDALLIHSDPRLLRLEETFSLAGDIGIPLFYTGFVAREPETAKRERFRHRLGIGNGEYLVVASVGGGRSGGPLLKAITRAVPMAKTGGIIHLHLFTGPFAAPEIVDYLSDKASETVRISRFTGEFMSYLAAADLSVSMGGYNTCMNILAAGTPALVWPFPDDREQGVRAQKMAKRGVLEVIKEADLCPVRLAALVDRSLARRSRNTVDIDLNGAKNTAKRIEALERQKT